MASAQYIELEIEGMSCNNCALGVKKYLEKKGADEVHVDFANKQAVFTLPKSSDNGLKDMVLGIEKLGFKVVSEQDEASRLPLGWSLLSWKLMVCALFTIPLMLSMFLPIPLLHSPIVQMLLTLPVFAIGGHHFGTSAYHSVRSGVMNMDVLIIIGASAAFLYSLVGFVQGLGPNYMFWETAASIITLVLLGNWLEHRAVARTTKAMKALSALQPSEARKIISETGQVDRIEKIPTKQLKVGDLLLVNTGDVIPIDGELIEGKALVDESMMTGESLSITKSIGSTLIGGTILTNGSIKMKATRVGKDTSLQQIVDLVRKAQSEHPPIQKLADKISSVFVPVVLLIAAATFLVWYFVIDAGFQKAIMSSIAVLLISCPCAMGLATPTAVMVGIGRAAKKGILMKGGELLERLSAVQQIVFDKTGTLTEGKQQISKLEIIDDTISEEELANALVGLEQHSNHPIASSLVSALKEKAKQPLQFDKIQENKGIGISGVSDGTNVYIAGSYQSAKHLTEVDSYQVYIQKNGQLIAMLSLDDQIRSTAGASIRRLQEDGITTILLSGDREERVSDVAQQLNISSHYSEQLPHEKLDHIANLKDKGVTAMVGDGINDAPALAKADIGISLSNATQVAMESADVILLHNDLNRLVDAVNISTHTVKTIRQNLFWAFFYNILCIPIAAMGFLHPMFAVIAMSLSDVFVIGNSLRLGVKKID